MYAGSLPLTSDLTHIEQKHIALQDVSYYEVFYKIEGTIIENTDAKSLKSLSQKIFIVEPDEP